MISLSFPTQKLKKFIKRVNIKLRDTEYRQEALIVYGVTNKNGITITGNQTSEDLSNYLILKESQFAYNPYRINVGSLGLASKGLVGLVSPAYIVFETTKELSSEFLYYYLKSSLGINLIKWHGDRGGVRSALRYNDLCEIDIPDLSLEKQIILLNKMKKININLEKFNDEISYQQEFIIKMRQSILQKAVEGKLLPQDHNDESASVLLKKIAKEKEELIKKKKIKNENPLLEISVDDINYTIPNTWKFERLGNIATTITDGTHQTPNYCETGMMFLSAQNVKPFKFLTYNYRCISKSDYDGYVKNVKPELGDVLLTRVGSNIGEAAIIDKCLDFAIYVSLCLIKMNKNSINPNFICLWLNSPDGTEKSISNILGRGTSQGNLNLSLIRNFVIPVPPLAEQKRIVEKVDQLMSLCDELEKNIEQSKKDCELLMQSVMQKAFNDNVEEKDGISFGEYIKQKRKEEGITVTEMLKLLKNVKSSEYTKIEEGLVKPEKIIINKIAEALKLSEIEAKSFEKLKIKVNVDEHSNPDYELKIAARRINKN